MSNGIGQYIFTYFLPVYDIIKDIMNNNKQLDTQMKTADRIRRYYGR